MARPLDGTGRQKCTRCDHRSIAGLFKGRGLCPYHYASAIWGKKWAAECFPNHPEAQ